MTEQFKVGDMVRVVSQEAADAVSFRGPLVGVILETCGRDEDARLSSDRGPEPSRWIPIKYIVHHVPDRIRPGVLVRVTAPISTSIGSIQGMVLLVTKADEHAVQVYGIGPRGEEVCAPVFKHDIEVVMESTRKLIPVLGRPGVFVNEDGDQVWPPMVAEPPAPFKVGDRVRMVAEQRKLWSELWSGTLLSSNPFSQGESARVDDVSFAHMNPGEWAVCVAGAWRRAQHLELAPPPSMSQTRCPRCGGPAYEGLLSLTCEREGGCKTLDERMGDPAVEATGWPARGNEVFYVAYENHSSLSDAARKDEVGVHPTIDGAIELWRAKMRAKLLAEDAKA